MSRLFADASAWHVEVPRESPVIAGVLDKLVALLDPERAIDDVRDALWIMAEPVGVTRWKRMPELRGGRNDVELWFAQPIHRLALPHVVLGSGTVDLTLSAEEPVAMPPHTYRPWEDGFLLAVPFGEALPPQCSVTYPSRPGGSLDHLADLRNEPNAPPTLRSVTLDRETRPGVLLPPPMAIARSVEVPPGGSVHFGVGIEGTGFGVQSGGVYLADSSSDGVGFRMEVVTEDGATVVWDQLVTSEQAGTFLDFKVGLEQWSGQQVTLRLSTYGARTDTGEIDNSETARVDDFAYLSDPVLAPSTHHQSSVPNVLIVLLDTLRADALGCYGGDLVETPVLDGLAAEGVLFEEARASCSWTLPSHASLFASLLPAQHRVFGTERLPQEAVTMAEVVRDAGWRTLAVTERGFVAPEFGMAQGFDRFDVHGRGVEPRCREMLDWIGDTSLPFFAFLHTYEVHTPYDPPAEYRSRYVPEYDGSLPAAVTTQILEAQRLALNGARPEQTDIDYVRALYHAEVAYVDEVLGDLFAELRQRGLWENTLVIVTSDHGEEFWEHGDHTHGHTLYDEVLRVPLIVHHPEAFAGGRRVDAPVRLEDIAPTVAEFLGLPLPPEWIGVSLTQPDAPRDILATLTSGRGSDTVHALVRDRHKWIQAEPGFYRCAPELGAELFDLQADPGERASVSEEAIRAEMKRALEAAAERSTPVFDAAEQVQLSGDEIEGLRGLGYVK